MKKTYLISLGTLFFLLKGSVTFAAQCEAHEIEFAQEENICAIVTKTYKHCPGGYYPSRYLDKKHGLHCYKCATGTNWDATSHKCS
jgi:hypothetical protein